MSLVRGILRFAAPAPKLEGFERYLFIGPHPDDIEIGAGATAARLVEEGKQVCFLICTDGRYGLDYAPVGTTPEALAALRQQEALAAAASLGVTDVRFLGLSDGAFYSEEELLFALARAIGDFGPQVIFAPDPDVSSECHADHLNVGRASKRLSFFAPFASIMARYRARPAPVQALALYMTAHPNRFVNTRGRLERQLTALLLHKTQFPADSPAYRSLALYLHLRHRSFLGREGFRVLGQTQMHCLPEAGL